MKPVLVDTGFIVACLDRSERHHARCLEVASALKEPLITCEPVIAESCYLLRKLGGAKEAVLQNVEQAVFQIPFLLSARAGEVGRLLTKYADVPMDLADGCLVDLANQFLTGKILTLDRDFTIYRWGRNRAFEILLELD